MIEALGVLLMTAFLMHLDYKIDASHRLKLSLQNRKGKIYDMIFELMNCHFCKSFWISVLSYVMLFLYYGGEFDPFIPFYACGAYSLINSLAG